jgi:predicted phage tail protein
MYMFATDGTHRRLLAAVLAFAAPVLVLGACNDDPLFDLPPDPPTNVTAAVQGNDVTIGWTPGVNATSQEVRVSPVVAVPASAGNALQADDLVQTFNDNTTNTALFEDLDAGAYTATVTAINASSRAPSEIATFTIAGASTTPTITTFTAAEGGLLLEWTAVENAEGYRVTFAPDGGDPVFDETLSTSPTN